MQNDDVIIKIRKVIAEDLNVNLKEEEIDVEASFFEDGLGLDSIAIVELVTLLEDRFKIQFSDSDLTKEVFQNTRTLASLITTKINN